MRMNVLAAVMALVALGIAPGAQAADPANFDFNGYAIVPTTNGGTLTMRSVLTNNGVVPTPIPLDFATYQYTLVVVGTRVSAIGITHNYNPVSIQMWSDLKSGGTAADYAIPSTFTDGTLILSGVFDGNLTRTQPIPTVGSFIGEINFTGGSMLGALATTDGWPFGGGWSRVVMGIPSGYNEMWDGKIDLAPVAVETGKWGAVKGLFR